MTSKSGWNIWVWLVGVVVRRYILTLTTYPYSSCICSFLQHHPYFLFIIKNVFRSCIMYIPANKIYYVVHGEFWDRDSYFSSIPINVMNDPVYIPNIGSGVIGGDLSNRK